MLDIRRARENSDGGKRARPKLADEEMPRMALQNKPIRRALHFCRCRVWMGNIPSQPRIIYMIIF